MTLVQVASLFSWHINSLKNILNLKILKSLSKCLSFVPHKPFSPHDNQKWKCLEQ